MDRNAVDLETLDKLVDGARNKRRTKCGHWSGSMVSIFLLALDYVEPTYRDDKCVRISPYLKELYERLQQGSIHHI